MVTLMTSKLTEIAPDDDESQSQSQDVSMAEAAEDDESQRRNRLACFQLFTKFTKEVRCSTVACASLVSHS